MYRHTEYAYMKKIINRKECSMMMVLKRKEIMAAALVVLIGVAGYLNWSYQDTVKVTDGDTYVETGKKMGEAQYVNAMEENAEDTESEPTASNNVAEENKTADSGDYFTNAKLEKENSRSRAIEILKETAANEGFDEDIRKSAQQSILDIAGNVEHETAIENMAKAKGYAQISVYIDEGTANVAVKKEGLSENDIAKIQEIVVSQVNISAQNVKIIEVK